MELFVGFMLCIFVELLLLSAWRIWRKLTTPTRPPQPPITAAQQANAQAFHEVEANTPRVVRPRIQRRTARGHRRRVMEREYNHFED